MTNQSRRVKGGMFKSKRYISVRESTKYTPYHKNRVWLIRDKHGKMRRSIWFLKVHADIVKKDYEEIIPIDIISTYTPTPRKRGK